MSDRNGAFGDVVPNCKCANYQSRAALSKMRPPQLKLYQSDRSVLSLPLLNYHASAPSPRVDLWHICVCVYLCMCACVHVCMCVYVDMCVCICVYVYMCVIVRVYVYVYMCVCTCMCVYVHVSMSMNINMNITILMIRWVYWYNDKMTILYYNDISTILYDYYDDKMTIILTYPIPRKAENIW